MIVQKLTEQEWKDSSKQIPRNGIFLINDLLSPSICKEIIKYIDENSVEESLTSPCTNVKAMTILPVELKKNKKIMSYLDNATNTLASKLSASAIRYSVEITGRCHYQLRKIYGPTKCHIDRTTEDHNEYVNSKKLRVFSVILAFNDDYEGGELCFPVQNCETKLKRGQAIAFPPYWTHPHYTNDLKNDTYRYTLTVWLYGNS
tara:strand:- start:231 stop:839 length:609 start_codon:yes stop_codon:yes gene_type:complete